MARRPRPFLLLLLPLILLPATSRGQDPGFDVDPPPVSSQRALSELAERQQTPTGRRARAILDAKARVDEADLRQRLLDLGVDTSPDAPAPDAATLQKIQTLAADLRMNFPFSQTLEEVDEYLRQLSERRALALVKGIDFSKLTSEYTDDEIKILQSIADNDGFRQTTVADRAKFILGERASRRRLDALALQMDPQIKAEFDAAAKRELAIVMRLVPSQRLRQLRLLAEVYRDTPTAERIKALIPEQRKAFEQRDSRRTAGNATSEAHRQSVKAYWDARYGRYGR